MQSLYTSGYDAVRIQMPDTQSTYRVYGDDYVSSWMWPTVGQLVKQNNGQSDFIGWGEILDDWHCWTNSGQQLCGAKMTGVGGVGGDSGAPVYVPYTHLYALGINFGGDGSGNGLFTRVGDVLAYMDVDLVVGP